jgi:hypothetical protein
LNYEALADKLHKDGVGIKGRDIFIQYMPETAETGVLIRNTFIGGLIDYELPDYRRDKFSLVVRSKKYKTAEALMRKAMKSLTMSETTLPGMDIRFIRPERDFVTYPLNEADLHEFLVIFEAVYVIL